MQNKGGNNIYVILYVKFVYIMIFVLLQDVVNKELFFYLIFGNLVKVICICSKLVYVVDLKLFVFMNYEYYLKE